MLGIIVADQAGVMDSIINAKLKQNTELVVYNSQLSISPSRGYFWETRLIDQYRPDVSPSFFTVPDIFPALPFVFERC